MNKKHEIIKREKAFIDDAMAFCATCSCGETFNSWIASSEAEEKAQKHLRDKN